MNFLGLRKLGSGGLPHNNARSRIIDDKLGGCFSLFLATTGGSKPAGLS